MSVLDECPYAQKKMILKWRFTLWKNSFKPDKIEIREMAELNKKRYWRQIRKYEEKRNAMMSLAM